MKIAVIVLAVLVAIWFFKASRRGGGSTQKSAPKKSESHDLPALDMVKCQFCEVHLPRPDAIEGTKGSYCSLEHQRQAEP